MKARFGSALDSILTDFPEAEIWRLMSDAWQHQFGPNVFTPAYYQGLQDGFCLLSELCSKEEKKSESTLSTETILELYKSATKKHKDFSSASKQKGFRDGEMVGFELWLKNFEKPNSAHLTQHSIDEFVEAVINAYSHDPILWKIGLVEPGEDPDEGEEMDIKNFIEPESKKISKEKLREFLLDKLEESSSEADQCLSFDESHHVMIYTEALSADQINDFITKKLAEFQKEINSIAQDEEKAEDKKLAAIARIIRELHQLHPFIDGNGRTFIFLLKNLLLMKYLNTFSFTMTPSHFSAFSINELVAEMKQDIALFNDFKITRAREYLTQLDAKDFGDLQRVKDILSTSLSKNPLIAMTQLNDLFVKIKGNMFPVPKGYQSSALHLLGSDKRDEHQTCLILLKELYLEKFQRVLTKNSRSTDMTPYFRFADKDALLDMMKLHPITSDETYVCRRDSIQTKMQEEIARKLDGLYIVRYVTEECTESAKFLPKNAIKATP